MVKAYYYRGVPNRLQFLSDCESFDSVKRMLCADLSPVYVETMDALRAVFAEPIPNHFGVRLVVTDYAMPLPNASEESDTIEVMS